MTKKEGLEQVIDNLNGRMLIDVALRLGVLDLTELELKVRDCHLRDIEQTLRDVGAFDKNPLKAIWAQWPGDESIEEILEALKALDG